jgi:hypothetical protein
VTGLLPDVVRETLQTRGLYATSASYGVVALALLLTLLIERETLRAVRADPERTIMLQAVCAPLLVVVGLTLLLRVTALL